MHCPALDGPLCSRCCGTGRGREIKCTSDCEFNPFGVYGYQRYSEIDRKLPSKMMRIMASNGVHESGIQQMTRKFSLESGGEGESGVFGWMMDWFFHESVSDLGDSRWDRREELGFGQSLTHDETRIMEARRHSLPTLFELQRTEGVETTWARDLLNPDVGELRIMDRSLVKRFEPYLVVFGYLTPLDHFWRPEASISAIPHEQLDELIDFIALESEEHTPAGKKRWLRLHSPMVAEHLQALVKQARQEFLDNLDPTLVHVIYRSSWSPRQWVKHFHPLEEFEEGNPEDGDGVIPPRIPVLAEFEWLRLGGSSNAPRSALSRSRVDAGGRTTELLGTIMIADGYVAISCYGKVVAAWLREQWEQEFAPSDLVFERESTTDLRELTGNEKRLPSEKPTFEKASEITRQFEQRHFQELLRETVPALNGMTPIQAAKRKSPADRKVLESWAKGLVQNLYSRYGREGAEFAWFFEEIGCAGLMPEQWVRH